MSSRPPDWTRLSMTGEHRSRILSLLEGVARDLLSHFGRGCDGIDEAGGERIRWSDPVALIGFAGPHAAGSLAIATPLALLRATHPSSKDASEDDLLDWSREMANLFLGSFKLELVRRGVSIEMGLPTTVLGSALELRFSGGTGIGVRVRAAGDLGTLDVLLDMALSPSANFHDSPEPLEGGPGDVLF